MASPELGQLVEQLRAFRTSVVGDKTLEERRAGGEMMSGFGTDPGGVETREIAANGCPALWQQGADADTTRVILYLHGGGGVVGSARSHERLVAHLAVETGCPVLNLDFRLAPEHPFPAALEDALGGYRWLLEEGYAPANIALGGDSLGGGLVLGLLVRLRDAGEPLPGAAVVMSPWVDLAMTAESIQTRADRDLLADGETFNVLRDFYVGDTDPMDRVASPLYSDLDGLPPLYIQVSDDEVLVDDSKRLAERGRAAGVDVSLDIFDGVPHVFQLWAGNVPESDDAVGRIGAFLRARLGLGAGSTATA
jgi:monoterpene epsilon-lactone hydrolase